MAGMEIHCTLTGHGLVEAGKQTDIPDGMTLNFYTKEGRKLPVGQATAMWEALQKNNKEDYSENPDPTQPCETVSRKTTKFWIGFPTEAEGWKAGVYYHGGAVDKEPDLIDMHNDPEIKKRNKAKNLDLDYMLAKMKEAIRKKFPEGNIVVHVLACREWAP